MLFKCILEDYLVKFSDRLNNLQFINAIQSLYEPSIGTILDILEKIKFDADKIHLFLQVIVSDNNIFASNYLLNLMPKFLDSLLRESNISENDRNSIYTHSSTLIQNYITDLSTESELVKQ